MEKNPRLVESDCLLVKSLNVGNFWVYLGTTAKERKRIKHAAVGRTTHLWSQDTAEGNSQDYNFLQGSHARQRTYLAYCNQLSTLFGGIFR